METNTNQQKVVDAEIISTENHSSKYGSQLTVVEKDFATLFEGSDMKKHLSSLKRKYSGLKVKDVNDTETYEEIKKAISVVRPLRTAMDKKRKEVNKEAKSFIDSVNDMGAKIQAEIAKIEDPLWSEREKFENLQKEEAERAEKVAKEKLDNRVSELISNGIVFTGMWYGIGQIQVGIQMIQEMSDDDYNDLLSKVKVQNDLNISEQKRKDEEAQAEKEKQEAITAQNKKDKEELEAGRLELRSGQLELLGIAITTEYELLMKTASNDDWKARYEQLKSDKLKSKRTAELQPYIVYIRDYKAMIGMDEETYQKELSGVKQAKIDQEEYNRQEAQKEFDRQERELKEKEAKIKAERELLAEKAKPFQDLGFTYNFNSSQWSLQVGQKAWTITPYTLLADEYDIVEIKAQIESARKEKEEAEVREAMDKLAEHERKAKEAEEKRKLLLDDTQKYNEYINAVSQIEIPQVNDVQLSEVLKKIKSLLVTK